MRAPLRPARLRPGDVVALVAPSGPVPRATFEAGAAQLQLRYHLRWHEALFARTGFLAGDDRRRAAELQAALADPSVRAIVCARGGYGLLRILPALDLAPLVADPRPIVGFSDITALHAACLRAGVATLHAPVVTQLGRLEGGDFDLFARLESEEPPPPFVGLTPIAPGQAEGRAVGGNLEVFTRLLGTPYLPDLDGAVLFLEEVSERPYRLDRALTHLALAGVFDRVAAVVVGELTRCNDPDEVEDRVLPAAVIAERLSGLGIPVVADAPFGHGDRNRAFPLGARVRVDAGRGEVTFLEGLVRDA